MLRNWNPFQSLNNAKTVNEELGSKYWALVGGPLWAVVESKPDLVLNESVSACVTRAIGGMASLYSAGPLLALLI